MGSIIKTINNPDLFQLYLVKNIWVYLYVLYQIKIIILEINKNTYVLVHRSVNNKKITCNSKFIVCSMWVTP